MPSILQQRSEWFFQRRFDWNSTLWYDRVTVTIVSVVENIVVMRNAIVTYQIVRKQMSIAMCVVVVNIEIQIMLTDILSIVWLVIVHGVELHKTLLSVISYDGIRMILQSHLRQQKTRMMPIPWNTISKWKWKFIAMHRKKLMCSTRQLDSTFHL